ncbi:unnamed protein product [Rhodiola kirilowii]
MNTTFTITAACHVTRPQCTVGLMDARDRASQSHSNFAASFERSYIYIYINSGFKKKFLSVLPEDNFYCREEVAEYCTEARGLVLRLLEAISESLGLEKEYIKNEAIGKHGQHMALNYYPPCPQPELTYGLPGHTDPNLITLLLQDDVPGLQVQRDGKWVAVEPIPDTFIVNMGDQMQVISNGRYKSVLHRAVVNCEKKRISIPTFYCPSNEAVIKPAPKLVSASGCPAVYKSFSYAEYYAKFWDRDLKSESLAIDLFKTK